MVPSRVSGSLQVPRGCIEESDAMDNSMMGRGGLFPGSAAGILDLDPSIQHRHHLHHPPPPAPHLHPIPAAGGLDSDHPMHLFDPSRSPSSAGQKGVAFLNPLRGKGISPSATTSDDDDDDHLPTAAAYDDSYPNGGARGKKASPWQRMKWTDDMVRLLITLVAYVGDDGPPESAVDGSTAKRKSGAALQKKGKWKTVSKLMVDKGCFVSPQQCEDKFNDLNKRYKRLNEILGRGTSCQVVENPSLLDSMTHISAKSKDDVRKILSSKHLFYREMCAYHNGQRIIIPNCQDFNLEGCESRKVESLNVEEVEDDEEEEENEDDEERSDDFDKMGQDSFRVEIDGVLRDPARSPWEQREWFRKRALQLQEERVEIQMEAFELEKRRLKWQRFCSNKDRELDRLRLENERLRLENERMVMEVRQKEMELDSKRYGEPSEFAGFRADGEHGRVQ